MGKRIFDFIVSLLALLALSPLLAGLAAAALISSGRPVIFRQRRVGWHGLCFTLYKFRTMTPAAGAEDGAFDAGRTARVTPLGRFLRRTKLDELPQLWNVLKGDMSLVGPRPEVRKWVEAYPERWRFVHTVQPGITDPASLHYRNEEELLARAADPESTYRDIILPDKLSLYEDYIRRRGFGTDLTLIVRSVGAMFWRPERRTEPR
jgi:lipopolysaccharide/colanic/teichoic acid biosynthesis glycosyltransferase